MSTDHWAKTQAQIEELHQQQLADQGAEAGVSEAGVLKAGSPGLVVSTPELRQQTEQWLMDQMSTADMLFQDSFYICTQPGHRPVDQVILAQAQQTRTMLLWLAQCAGLVQTADAFSDAMSLDDNDAAILRRAQDVAEVRSRR